MKAKGVEEMMEGTKQLSEVISSGNFPQNHKRFLDESYITPHESNNFDGGYPLNCVFLLKNMFALVGNVFPYLRRPAFVVLTSNAHFLNAVDKAIITMIIFILR